MGCVDSWEQHIQVSINELKYTLFLNENVLNPAYYDL